MLSSCGSSTLILRILPISTQNMKKAIAVAKKYFSFIAVPKKCYSSRMSHQQAIRVHNIILIGFMGCGKSTIGRELKRLLRYQFIDMDAEIEAREQKSIATIFAEDGEPTFRQKETELLQEFLAKGVDHSVISTGGGAILSEENRNIIKSLGFVVWLKADAQTIYHRTKKNHSRPILQTANPQQVIADLLELRTPLYLESAHLTIEVKGLNRTEIAGGIIESARYFFAQHEA
jgi:shikimate kinase